ACLMTGRYNYRTRCIDTYIGRAMMEPDETTIAEILADAGYATGIFGKWHLGDCYPMRPMDQGFSESLVHRGGGIGQPSDPPGAEGKYTDPVLFRNGTAEPQTGYCTDIYYRNAMAFIRQSTKDERPFFVYLPDNCPHSPFHDVPADLYEQYRQLDLGNDLFPQQDGHKLPAKHDHDKRARIYTMISNVDRNIGHLFRMLEELELTQNTIVIFMVDNGPNTQRYVAGMRGRKTTVYEGGVRSPFFIQWPAKLKAGHQVDRVCAHIDVMPTLLDACDVDTPEGLQLDGLSFLPELQEQPIDRPDRNIVIQSHRGNSPVRFHNFMIRNNRWKLLNASGFRMEKLSGAAAFELYDLQADSLEMNDVAAQHPDVVRRLKAAYETWFEDVGSTRPDNYAPPRIHVDSAHENPTVLTRQDWRHTSGKAWHRNSVGHWLLHVADAGPCVVRCRFNADKVAGRAVLIANNDRYELPIPEARSECVFNDVMLPAGPLRVEITLQHGDTIRGIHQADILR
ncbi:MAG: arylsulfatase, partial [Planctomycetaceae bacterium]